MSNKKLFIVKTAFISMAIYLSFSLNSCNTPSNNANQNQTTTADSSKFSDAEMAKSMSNMNFKLNEKINSELFKTNFNNTKSFNILLDNKILPLDSTSNTPNICGNLLPKTLGELNQIDKSASIVTKTAGIDLKLFGIEGSLNRRDVLIISNFIVYKDFTCGDSTKRVSVGIQVYIHATSKSYKVSTADILKLAAAVQLGQARADYRLHIFGLTNAKDIYKNLPGSTFDVDTYAKIVSSFDGIISTLSTNVVIDPIVSTNNPL